jgi:hypothetical protein
VKESVPADPPNRFRWVDEIYVRVAGAWTYLYRAVDATGQTITIDFTELLVRFLETECVMRRTIFWHRIWEAPTMRIETEVSRYRVGDFLSLKFLDDDSSAKAFSHLGGAQ